MDRRWQTSQRARGSCPARTVRAGHLHGAAGVCWKTRLPEGTDDPPHYEEWINVAGGAYIGAVLKDYSVSMHSF